MFTSGTQARDGRTVNHDPEPWTCEHCGKRSAVEWGLDRYGRTYDPRPEFAVLDNPILAAFRKRVALYYYEEMSVLAAAWLRGSVLTRVAYNAGATLEQIDHARRVLSKIAGMYA